jgi:hypothetical protein
MFFVFWAVVRFFWCSRSGSPLFCSLRGSPFFLMEYDNCFFSGRYSPLFYCSLSASSFFVYQKVMFFFLPETPSRDTPRHAETPRHAWDTFRDMGFPCFCLQTLTPSADINCCKQKIVRTGLKNAIAIQELQGCHHPNWWHIADERLFNLPLRHAST